MDGARYGASKWRPLQMSLALTDHLDETTGGIGVAAGWHTRIEEYASRVNKNGRKIKNHKYEKLPRAQFNLLSENAHPEIHADKRMVVQPAGSLCIWDNRLPHYVTSQLTGSDTREIMFTTFLPAVDVNRRYVQQQLTNMYQNKPPPDFSANETLDYDENHQLTALQRKLLGIDEW